MKELTPVMARIPKELHIKAKVAAAMEDISLQEIVRKSIEQYLESKNKEEK